MTTKTYKSPSNIAINVVLSNGSNLLVSFSSKTIGGSIFTTSNEEVQQAIERHYNYNKLFFLEGTVITEDKVSKTKKNTPVNTVNKESAKSENISNDEPKEDNSEATEEETEKDEELTAEEDNKETESTEEVTESDVTTDGMTKVEFTDLVSAREYLNENFGIPKQTIMSKASIIEAAKAHNIVFVGLS